MILPGTLFIALLGGVPGAPAQDPAPDPRAAPTQEPAVFGAQVSNVYVDAFVSRQGDPVLGLTAPVFELKDNGVPQRFELVSAESLPLLAVLAFDTSNSLVGPRLEALRAAGEAFLESLRPKDEVALFAFSAEIQWLARPTADKSEIQKALARLQPSGATAVIDALYAALTLPETRSRTLVVLFTDGQDNMSWLDWRQMQVVAERSNAMIHVVGLRREPEGPVGMGRDLAGRMLPMVPGNDLEFENTWALREIAETTGGRYWEAESPERLKTAFTAITETMGHRYVLRYEPQGVPRKGWHKIELRLRGEKGEVHTRNGYWVGER